MLILLLIVFILYLCESQMHYQIHTIIQYHELIVSQLIYKNLLSDQDVVSDEISHSYDHTTSYPMDSFFYQESK